MFPRTQSISLIKNFQSLLKSPISQFKPSTTFLRFLSTVRMSSSPSKYDSIVIGSGQAGTPLASALVNAGHKTALIERTHIGGCCINEGCTPTKTMIASGRAAYMVRRGADYGIHSPGPITVDMMKVRQRKRDIVESFRGGSESRTKNAGVEVFMGEASFVDATTLKVKKSDGTEEHVTGDTIFINTGERPVPPKLEGLEEVEKDRILDSTSIQELAEVPGHLVVLGGGYVGCEFGQLFRRLGAEVTIVQRAEQLLPREDKEIADALLNILKEDGITVLLGSTAKKVSSSSSSSSSFDLSIHTSTNGSDHTISGTHLLFAAGRIPNTETLNLPAAGVTTNSKGYIIANEFLETTAKGIYTLGDVKGPPAFTHISYDDFRIIRANLLSQSSSTTAKRLSTRDRLVPYVVYTDPQLGHVGLHEAEARAKFPSGNIKTAKMPMSYVARALETDEARGMMKAVVDGDTGKILGFTCLGLEGGEIMSIVQMAIMGGVGYEGLRDAVWAHPALAESLNNIWGYLQ